MKRNSLLIIVFLLATTVSFAQMNSKPKSANTASSTIEIAAIPDQTFTGFAITPEPVIKYGTLTLKKDADYTLSYSNNINAGAATVTVTGKGNYRDAKTVNFNIVPKSIGSPKASAISDPASQAKQ